MQLSDIITRDVETIRPDTPVKEAAQRMRSADIGSLPVCDGRRLLGMNVRMPTTLDEFYLPPDQRLYLPAQG